MNNFILLTNQTHGSIRTNINGNWSNWLPSTGIILLIAAFQEGVGWGIASFFCGFVLLYFCLMNLNQVYKPFLANIGFAIMYGIGVGLQN